MIGICEYVWSVASIERAVRPFVELANFDLQKLDDADRIPWLSLGLSEECTRIEQCLLIPRGEVSGRAIRVIRFHGVKQQLIRPAQHIWDSGGFSGLDILCPDPAAFVEKLEIDHGWSSWGVPVTYKAGGTEVTLVISNAPDGLTLGLLHIGPQDPDASATTCPFPMNSIQMVSDLNASEAFYRDVLGWKLQSRTLVDNEVEPGHRVLGLPLPIAKTTPRHILVYAPEDSALGSTEMFCTPELRGEDYSSRGVPPNIGLLVMRVRVADPAAHHAQVTTRGWPVVCSLETVTDERLGEIDRFVVRTPEGGLVELFCEAQGLKSNPGRTVGTWTINNAESRRAGSTGDPRLHRIEVLTDDGDTLHLREHVIAADGAEIRFEWSGLSDGQFSATQGAEFEVAVTRPAHTAYAYAWRGYGQSGRETVRISADGLKMLCTGFVDGPDGPVANDYVFDRVEG